MKEGGRIGLPFCSNAERSLKFKREGTCHCWPKTERKVSLTNVLFNQLQTNIIIPVEVYMLLNLFFGIDEKAVCGPFLFILVSCIEEDGFVCFTRLHS